ncbi:ATPase, T2SS/T4P/T4SS family [Halomonas sp. BC04]|uniref:ATPase, T2SS/T4P/T4SS family n=1 Tax=Halomonas sp. BC04 TaxID=1403540 RepID=UPI0003ED6442|nr:hypothetical protein [Halomonas sp. BC04]EWH03551.1 hypothetical protein Q427_02710 [Halomonas sp. BC04]
MSSTTDRHPRLLPSLASLLKNPPGPGDEGLEAHALLNDAIAARATDVHLDPVQAAYRIRLRIDGRVIDAMRMDAAGGLRLANQFKVLSGSTPSPRG